MPKLEHAPAALLFVVPFLAAAAVPHERRCGTGGPVGVTVLEGCQKASSLLQGSWQLGQAGSEVLSVLEQEGMEAVAFGNKAGHEDQGEYALRKHRTSAGTQCSQWGNMACSGSECYTCGDRITYLQSQGKSREAAGQQVAAEFPQDCGECGGGPCRSWCESDYNRGRNQGRHCSPGDMASLCGGCSFCGGAPSPPTTLAPPCRSWCESDYNRGRNQGRHCSPGDMASLCGGCSFCSSAPSPAPSPVPSPPTTPAPGPPGSSIRVMSYNTEYRGYWDGRMGQFAAKIREVAPAIVGLQECQNKGDLASQAGYTPLYGTSFIMFNSSKVSFVSDGRMRIPRDNYADRAITWGHFKLGNRDIYLFNTHLPHRHGEASDPRTHGRIAQDLLTKRRQLGIDNEPTIVTGDMNSHASYFNQVQGGGFESNLVDNGFVWAWEAKGNPGYPRIDSILYSGAHWTHSDCGDTGTGSSDHTSIACTVTLK